MKIHVSFFSSAFWERKIRLSALPKKPLQQSTRADAPFPNSGVSLKNHHEFKTRKLPFEEFKTLEKQIVSPNGMFKQARCFQSVTVQNRISLIHVFVMPNASFWNALEIIVHYYGATLLGISKPPVLVPSALIPLWEILPRDRKITAGTKLYETFGNCLETTRNSLGFGILSHARTHTHSTPWNIILEHCKKTWYITYKNQDRYVFSLAEIEGKLTITST